MEEHFVHLSARRSIRVERARRSVTRLAGALCVLGLVLGTGAVSAQTYPDKGRAIKIIVPSGPASAVDLLTRSLAKAMSEEGGVTVVVENKPGAENVIGVEALISSPPDGYTLLANSNSSQSLNPVMIPHLRYDPLKDMQPVATMSKTGLIMNLSGATPFKSAREFVEAAKKNPDKYTCASATTTQRMACEMLQARAGIKLLVVPYKQTAGAMTALASGEADAIFVDAGTAQAQWQSGRVRGVAVTLPDRMPALPKLPTLREEGVADFNMTAWYAVYAPAKTPPAVAATVREMVRKAANSKMFADTLAQFSMERMDLGPDEVQQLTRREIETWTKLVREQKVKIE